MTGLIRSEGAGRHRKPPGGAGKRAEIGAPKEDRADALQTRCKTAWLSRFHAPGSSKGSKGAIEAAGGRGDPEWPRAVPVGTLGPPTGLNGAVGCSSTGSSLRSPAPFASTTFSHRPARACSAHPWPPSRQYLRAMVTRSERRSVPKREWRRSGANRLSMRVCGRRRGTEGHRCHRRHSELGSTRGFADPGGTVKATKSHRKAPSAAPRAWHAGALGRSAFTGEPGLAQALRPTPVPRRGGTRHRATPSRTTVDMSTRSQSQPRPSRRGPRRTRRDGLIPEDEAGRRRCSRQDDGEIVPAADVSESAGF